MRQHYNPVNNCEQKKRSDSNDGIAEDAVAAYQDLPDDAMEVLVKNHRSKEAAMQAYKDNFRDIIKRK